MFRIALLLAMSALPPSGPAVDQDAACELSGEIVAAGMAERLGGADEQTAVRNVEDALPDDKAEFRPAVVHIVGWVYLLDTEKLGEDVAGRYVADCKAE